MAKKFKLIITNDGMMVSPGVILIDNYMMAALLLWLRDAGVSIEDFTDDPDKFLDQVRAMQEESNG